MREGKNFTNNFVAKTHEHSSTEDIHSATDGLTIPAFSSIPVFIPIKIDLKSINSKNQVKEFRRIKGTRNKMRRSNSEIELMK